MTPRRWTCSATRGYDHTYGARPLRRIIQNLIEDPLAEGLLNSRYSANSTIRVEVEDDLLKLVVAEAEVETRRWRAWSSGHANVDRHERGGRQLAVPLVVESRIECVTAE